MERETLTIERDEALGHDKAARDRLLALVGDVTRVIFSRPELRERLPRRFRPWVEPVDEPVVAEYAAQARRAAPTNRQPRVIAYEGSDAVVFYAGNPLKMVGAAWLNPTRGTLPEVEPPIAAFLLALERFRRAG